jgi:hypothetical protein
MVSDHFNKAKEAAAEGNGYRLMTILDKMSMYCPEYKLIKYVAKVTKIAAKHNYAFTVELILDKYKLDEYFDEIAYKAAKHGSIETLRVLQKFGYKDYLHIITGAASANHIDLIDTIIEENGLRHSGDVWNYVARAAAAHGYTSLVKIAIVNGSVDFKGIGLIAANCGHYEIAAMAREYDQGLTSDAIAKAAAVGGHLPIVLKMVDDEGAKDFEGIGQAALSTRHYTIALEMIKLGATSLVEPVAMAAAYDDRVYVVEQLDELGQLEGKPSLLRMLMMIAYDNHNRDFTKYLETRSHKLARTTSNIRSPRNPSMHRSELPYASQIEQLSKAISKMF